MAQEVGAHRKKVYSAAPTAEGELWRRAFWVLVAMDRSKSFALGRPCAIQDEELVSFLFAFSSLSFELDFGCRPLPSLPALYPLLHGRVGRALALRYFQLSVLVVSG